MTEKKIGRFEVAITENGTCFRCEGKTDKLAKHHIPPRAILRAGSKFWRKKVKFLIPVCPGCHSILDDETYSRKRMMEQYNWVAERIRGNVKTYARSEWIEDPSQGDD
ncbi:MAG: hypothetical protein ACW99J_19125 [Candidatus Thorarchaeota archaeon]